MRHYDTLKEEQRGPFKVIVDKTWEDIHPSHCFDDSVTDIKELCDKIDRGVYDWFMLRVRVLFDGHELGSHYLGGCLYENPEDVLTDGTAEDCIGEALHEAKNAALDLKHKLVELDLESMV
jgi:hypothetical protein